ncbi:VOC family protein [Leifsonia poae]|uniref:VOC family protein n=1 Tax=Leifsonia poae TaxID=110933 RepID=UPI001CBAFA60|nr:VOC family protein [Leifsonia poae]
MSVLTNHRLGEPCWVDYASSDVAASRDFYTSLFGWTADAAPEEYGGYITFRSNGHAVAGLGSVMNEQQATGWTTYLLVDDAAASEKAAVDAGATVFAPTMTVGSQGTMAVVGDPGGAAVGLWQPDQFAGFELAAEAGAPAWHELYAADYGRQLDFYCTVFGWHPQPLSDTDDFRYATFGAEGSPAGGVYDTGAEPSAGTPRGWVVYFGVTDADAACARVVELGGHVIRHPWDSEFGRFAEVADPQGGVFLLHHVQPE